jgi:hypothetical protein
MRRHDEQRERLVVVVFVAEGDERELTECKFMARSNSPEALRKHGFTLQAVKEWRNRIRAEAEE